MSDLRSFPSTRPGASSEFRPRDRTRFDLICEALETRQLLSTTTAAVDLTTITAQTNLHVLPLITPGPTGLTPQQITSAYGVNQVALAGGTGAGQTIAIVTAYNDPNITSDLASFDKQFGLSSPPSFTVKNLGGTTTDPGWALETSLDVEWAHSLAPGANILLVEASSATLSGLFSAVSYASQQPGVSVVSMSWGTPEFWSEASYDSIFTTPAGHTGVTFVAASGDSGAWYGPMYPSVSPNVLAVGGTTLSLSPSGGYGSETAWSGSTGGFSGLDSYWWTYEPQPSYQNAALQAVGLSYGVRTTPDVSFNADPNSGVAVYDSVSYGGQSGWFQLGGTSAATPAWAGLIAITDQGLANAHKGTLSGTQAQTQLYALPSTDFHDITSGSNGYSATPGYDLVTGLGSPKANLVISGLLSANGVSTITATTQANATTTTTTPTTVTSHRSSRQFDDTSTTTGTGSGSTTSNNQGTTGTGSTSISVGLIVLPSTTLSSGPFLAQALINPVTTTAAQPIAQATSTTVAAQIAAPALSLGQSIQPQQYSLPGAVDGEKVRSVNVVDDAIPAPPATPAPAEAPAAEQAPALENQPAPEVPAVTPVVAPGEPMSSLWTDQFDLALAQVSLSMEARRLAPAVAIPNELERPGDGQSTWSISALAGSAAIAAGGYRILLGRSDRIRRSWLRGRFPGL
jgi:subtilase family serine protease